MSFTSALLKLNQTCWPENCEIVVKLSDDIDGKRCVFIASPPHGSDLFGVGDTIHAATESAAKSWLELWREHDDHNGMPVDWNLLERIAGAKIVAAKAADLDGTDDDDDKEKPKEELNEKTA